jgi:HAD superfamily hydrolase (TIGR01509 family)
MPEKGSKIKVLVFDCDGVMFDTENANRLYYNRILGYFGKPELSKEQFDYVHMSTVKEALFYLFPERDDLSDVFQATRTMNYDSLIPHMEIEPYLKPLLHRVRSVMKTAIATNRSNTMNGVMVYHGLTDLFDLVVTSLDVERPKPHPDQLIKILEHFRIAPDEALYIGDSPTDEKAAESSGVTFVSYKNPSLKASHHIGDLREVMAILDL